MIESQQSALTFKIRRDINHMFLYTLMSLLNITTQKEIMGGEKGHLCVLPVVLERLCP